MRTIAVVTVARSDYGLYRPVLEALAARRDVQVKLLVAGAHLSERFGLTVRDIERDGFAEAERVGVPDDSDAPVAIAASIGHHVTAFAQALARVAPDLLVVLGDRFEMYAAAVAALPLRLPVAHIHGGELTFGAIDDALRHSITKLSHLHFVATEEYGRRVSQLGEEPWRVTVSGAPGLDAIGATTFFTATELGDRIGFDVGRPFVLATMHPVTLELDSTGWQIEELLAALETLGWPVLFTGPNADSGGRLIRHAIEPFVARHTTARLVENLGSRAYLSVLRFARVMVGNSSSGLIEAPSFELPVVNIGTRQGGRVRARNVVDVGYSRADILEGLHRAIDPVFREGLRGLLNPYGDGAAAPRIAERLVSVPLDRRLIEKRFHDVAGARAMLAGV